MQAGATGLGASAERIVTSKLYAPGESWTKADAWWFTVPPTKIEGPGALVLLAERPAGGFHVLAVDRAWLREHQSTFAFHGDCLKLFLDATSTGRFQERAGCGQDFARWHVGDTA